MRIKVNLAREWCGFIMCSPRSNSLQLGQLRMLSACLKDRNIKGNSGYTSRLRYHTRFLRRPINQTLYLAQARVCRYLHECLD